MIKTLLRTSPLFAAIFALDVLVSVSAPALAADDAQRCNRAEQCTGPLPMICVFCAKADHYVCAHHVCVHHRCMVQTCPEFGNYSSYK